MAIKTGLFQNANATLSTDVDEIRDHIDNHPGSSLGTKGMPGVAFDFYGAIAPAGSLVCEGQEVSKTLYLNLYLVIGDLWATTGGAAIPSTGNFRLPPSEIGGLGLFARGGVNIGNYEADENKNHTHKADHNHSASSAYAGTHTHSLVLHRDSWFEKGGSGVGYDDDNSHTGPTSTPDVTRDTRSNGNHKHIITVNTEVMNTDNSGSIETRPRSITVLKCIWY